MLIDIILILSIGSIIMDIFEKIRNLKFPQWQYVVVGSEPLVVRDIKPSTDIDIVVSPELFKKCEQEGRERLPWTYPDKLGHIYLKRGSIELYLDVNCGDFNPTLEELLARSDIIEEISFASLEDILQFKTAYNRPKHIQDIEKIKEYISHNKN